ncbi:hypothetical protein [uncultured Sphingomonas sp.]|uniref:hypothetical protein n=1 Tax=uncultured Sphingomonas sp. TaxID=158754 RepID=UPI0025F9C868|nr:hypothetical protein [uncultured Sphingomonas sp.]
MKAMLTAIPALLLAVAVLAQSPSCRDDPTQPRCVATGIHLPDYIVHLASSY